MDRNLTAVMKYPIYEIKNIAIKTEIYTEKDK